MARHVRNPNAGGRGSSATVAGQDIANYYTKAQTDAALASAGGGAPIKEAELDFGSVGSPGVYDKIFTVVDATVTPAIRIMMTESGNPATGRGAGDYLWDSIAYACISGTGSFTVHAKASPGPIIGKRNALYRIG